MLSREPRRRIRHTQPCGPSPGLEPGMPRFPTMAHKPLRHRDGYYTCCLTTCRSASYLYPTRPTPSPSPLLPLILSRHTISQLFFCHTFSHQPFPLALTLSTSPPLHSNEEIAVSFPQPPLRTHQFPNVSGFFKYISHCNFS